MAANCNVIPLVWDWVAQKSLSLTIGDLDLQPFIDEFNRVTGCREVIPCQGEEETKPCNQDEIYLCNFLIGTIDVATDPSGLTVIGAPISRYTNGFPPYGVFWSWDPAVFSLVSGQGTPSIILQKLPGIAPGTQTQVSVRADDGNGCKDSGDVTFGFPESIADCAAAVLVNPAMYLGVPYSGYIDMPYTGGNGADYSGMSVQSTGVLGLTASYPSGTLATGNGTLFIVVSGTPQSNGAAQFVLPMFGDDPCVFSFQVAEAVCQPTQADLVYHPFDSGSNTYPVEVLWIPRADATSYKIEFVIGTGAPSIIIVPAPASSTFVNVPPLAFFSVGVIVTCLFDSTPVYVSDTAPGVPAPCPMPTNLVANVIGWDPVTSLFTILTRWDIMTGAMAYIVRDVNAGVSFTQGGRTRHFFKPANTANQFGVTVDCGNLVDESPEALVSVTTPATPTAGPPANWPVIHYIDNVATTLLNQWFMQMWITVDGDADYVIVLQKDPFFNPGFQTDSKELMLGADNGYGTLPPGFGPADIFFGTETSPKGRTIYGSNLNYIRVGVVKGVAVALQGWVTWFDYWMNVPEQYTIRMSGEDYITTDPSFVRPTLTPTLPGPGELILALNTAPFNYDSCSKYNMFLVAQDGSIITRTHSGAFLVAQHYTGLAAGKYIAFAEMTRDACTVFTGNVETALPLVITIA